MGPVAADEVAREAPIASKVKIHREEGQVAGDVAATEARGELDAIVDPDPLVGHTDVAGGVKVTMTVADPLAAESALQERALACQKALGGDPEERVKRRGDGAHARRPGRPRLGSESLRLLESSRAR